MAAQIELKKGLALKKFEELLVTVGHVKTTDVALPCHARDAKEVRSPRL